MNTQRKAHVILVIIFGLFTVNGNAMEQSYPLSNKVGIFIVGCVVGACCVGAYYYHTMDKRLEQLEKKNKQLEKRMDEMERNRGQVHMQSLQVLLPNFYHE